MGASSWAAERFARFSRSNRPSPLVGPSHSCGGMEKDLFHLDCSFDSLASLDARLARRKNPRRFIKLGLPLFVCMRFQDLFHSPSGVLFAFPSRYWFTIGRLRVFSLGGWSPHLQTGLHVSRPTCRTLSSTSNFSRTGLSPTTVALSRAFHYSKSYHLPAAPRSLATTSGISVDFCSSGY